MTLTERSGLTTELAGDALWSNPRDLLSKTEDEITFIYSEGRRCRNILEGSATVEECENKMAVALVRALLSPENTSRMGYASITTESELISFLANQGSLFGGFKNLFRYSQGPDPAITLKGRV